MRPSPEMNGDGGKSEMNGEVGDEKYISQGTQRESKRMSMSEDKIRGVEADDTGPSLEEVAARLDRIEAALEKIVGIIDEGQALPGMAAMMVDVADEYVATAAAAGIDVDERVRQVMRVSMKVTDPMVLTTLERVLDRFEEFSGLVDLLEGVPASLAAVVDVVDDFVERAQEAGIDMIDMPRQLGESVLHLGRLVGSSEWKALLESGLLGPESLDLLARVGESLEESRQYEVKSVGPFGLFSALRDDDVGQTMGFALRFAGRFGRRIRGERKQKRLPM